MALARQSRHYLSQAGLAAAFARLLRARPNLERPNLYALLTHFSDASATLAAQDYADRRAAAGIRSRFTVRHAPAPSPEHFSKTLDFVYAKPQPVPRGLAVPTPPASLPSPAVVEAPDVQTAETDAEAELDRLVAAFTRLALQSGRMTVVDAVRDDSRARAWARETRADCCSFCALMAARGAVYKSEGTAGRDANDKFTGDGAFKFHNNCHCVAVPVFGEFEKSADARAWNRQYHDLKRELGRAPSLTEWRRRFDGPRQVSPENVPQTAGTN